MAEATTGAEEEGAATEGEDEEEEEDVVEGVDAVEDVVVAQEGSTIHQIMLRNIRTRLHRTTRPWDKATDATKTSKAVTEEGSLALTITRDHPGLAIASLASKRLRGPRQVLMSRHHPQLLRPQEAIFLLPLQPLPLQPLPHLQSI